MNSCDFWRYLPFALPEIGDEEIAEVVDTLKSGWITTGPKVLAFEAQFRERLHVPHAIAVNSASAAATGSAVGSVLTARSPRH